MLIFVRHLLKKTDVTHKFRTRTYTYDLPKLRQGRDDFVRDGRAAFSCCRTSQSSSARSVPYGRPAGCRNKFTVGPLHPGFERYAADQVVAHRHVRCDAAHFVRVGVSRPNERSVPRVAILDYLSLLPFVIPGVVTASD